MSANVSSAADPEQGFAGGYLEDLLGGEDVELEDDGGVRFELDRYGYRWFRIHGPESRGTD